MTTTLRFTPGVEPAELSNVIASHGYVQGPLAVEQVLQFFYYVVLVGFKFQSVFLPETFIVD